MGYIRHHTIVVTSWNQKKILKAHNKAIEIFNGSTSNIVESNFNMYYSFFVAPDGSKEGWTESKIGDDRRKKFIDWLNSKAYSDGSNALQFAELFYGDDDGNSKIINHN